MDYLSQLQDFHFLRPGVLLFTLPICLLWAWVARRKSSLQAWQQVCDPYLLEQLLKIQSKDRQRPIKSGRNRAWALLFLSSLSMVLALAGPAWLRLPVPAYRDNKAQVVVLDLSEAMLEKDLSPDRLSRAKFKLHDLLNLPAAGPFALIVFTGQPFVVSPLTEDANTIDSLLDMLLPDIMPVRGQRLDLALAEAARLIHQAGASQGQLLVMTASPPDSKALEKAQALAASGIKTSIMPIVADPALLPLFKPLSQAGQGRTLNVLSPGQDLEAWLKQGLAQSESFTKSSNKMPLWQDEGHWFVLPALLLLLPVFRRAWLQRIDA